MQNPNLTQFLHIPFVNCKKRNMGVLKQRPDEQEAFVDKWSSIKMRNTLYLDTDMVIQDNSVVFRKRIIRWKFKGTDQVPLEDERGVWILVALQKSRMNVISCVITPGFLQNSSAYPSFVHVQESRYQRASTCSLFLPSSRQTMLDLNGSWKLKSVFICKSSKITFVFGFNLPCLASGWDGLGKNIWLLQYYMIFVNSFKTTIEKIYCYKLTVHRKTSESQKCLL